VELASNHIYFYFYFLISYAVAFIASGVTAYLYLWPEIAARHSKEALTPLLLYACLRVNGLMFLEGVTVSDGHYATVFQRLAGMPMTGPGLNIAGMIRARG
jgi:hypothetical protein